MHTVIPVFVLAVVLSIVIKIVLCLRMDGYFCQLLGHAWEPKAPWTGHELKTKRPDCKRCGIEPDEIQILDRETTNKGGRV